MLWTFALLTIAVLTAAPIPTTAIDCYRCIEADLTDLNDPSGGAENHFQNCKNDGIPIALKPDYPAIITCNDTYSCFTTRYFNNNQTVGVHKTCIQSLYFECAHKIFNTTDNCFRWSRKENAQNDGKIAECLDKAEGNERVRDGVNAALTFELHEDNHTHNDDDEDHGNSGGSSSDEIQYDTVEHCGCTENLCNVRKSQYGGRSGNGRAGDGGDSNGTDKDNGCPSHAMERGNSGIVVMVVISLFALLN